MFKLVDNPTFKHTVTAVVPIDGGHREEDFDVTYNVLEPDEVGGFELSTNEGTKEFLLAIVKRLDDVGDAEGKPMPYSDALRDDVLKLPYARAAISSGYFEAITKAKKGN
ncbi:MAG: hypothetical protein KUG65_13180 [Sphingomonadaceae bacterium]|nr:hypothetical protein [Sphingomonadaceae bacterium]